MMVTIRQEPLGSLHMAVSRLSDMNEEFRVHLSVQEVKHDTFGRGTQGMPLNSSLLLVI